MACPNRLRILRQAAKNPAITERYWAKIVRPESWSCWLWTGAISGRGHGRFWIGDGLVVVAHRFGWLINAGEDAALPEVVRHSCDNPICQNPLHLVAGTWSENRLDDVARRGVPGAVLNDVRGAGARARALRDAARAGEDLDQVAARGLSALDRYQSPLW